MRRAESREQDIGEDVLVHKFRLNSAICESTERDTTQHTISIEPVSVTTQILVGNRVAAISNVLAASELRWNIALIRAFRKREGLVNGGEVAGEVAIADGSVSESCSKYTD